MSLDLDPLKDWLARQALVATPPPRLATRVAETLTKLGLPLLRFHIAMSALHPQVESIGVTWRRGKGVELDSYGHGAFEAIRERSPFYTAVRTAQAEARSERGAPAIPLTRYRVEQGEGLDLDLLQQFKAEGATDYICFVLVFGRDGRGENFLSGGAVSFTTDRPGGFTDEEIASLRSLMAPLGAAMRVTAQVQTTEVLLDTYLGRNVGARVLNGEIHRGSVQTISAAILFADLRGFTALAETAPGPALIDMLGAYFDILVGAIEAERGHVLKFLGDGLLATFAYENDGAGCALCAARAALPAIAALNEKRAAAGQLHTSLGIALHAGDVLFGNVGSDKRLDFTIIGPAVNETARLQGLCSTLGAPLIASRTFVDRLKHPSDMQSLGAHDLRGIARPVEVFAPR